MINFSYQMEDHYKKCFPCLHQLLYSLNIKWNENNENYLLNKKVIRINCICFIIKKSFNILSKKNIFFPTFHSRATVSTNNIFYKFFKQNTKLIFSLNIYPVFWSWFCRHVPSIMKALCKFYLYRVFSNFHRFFKIQLLGYFVLIWDTLYSERYYRNHFT